MINYILTNNLEFREYVQAYTNASFLLNEQYQDTEDLDGLFSGYEPQSASYDRTTWSYESVLVEEQHGRRDKEQSAPYQSGAGGPIIEGGATEMAADPALQHPRCVFQVLKRHFARYTPEMVEQICGVPQDLFLDVCRTLTENSGRERTGALVYSVGWTQHTVGPQYIRAGAIIQLLLGNIGRPGGGVYALRGHASIQGSTDIPTLFNLLPGYLPMPDDLAPGPGQLPGHRQRRQPEGLLAQRRHVHDLAAEGVLGRRGDAGQRLLLRLPAADQRGPRHVPHRDGHGGREGLRLLPAGPESRGGVGSRPPAAAGPGQAGLAGGPRPGHDRERHILEGRARDRDR